MHPLLHCYNATMLHYYIAKLLQCYNATYVPFLYCYFNKMHLFLSYYYATIIHCYIAIMQHM